MKKVAVIGMGNMGSAIALSIRDRFTLTAFDIDKEKVGVLGFKPSGSIDEAVEDADIILIAIKPQFIDKDFLKNIKRDGKSYISIAAGIPLSALEENLGSRDIARFMPNLAAKEKKAVTAVCFSKDAAEDFKKDAMEVANSIGSAFILPEKSFSTFIGASGSLIAFALEFIRASAMGAVNMGIPYKEAEKIVSDTVASALTLLKDGKNAGEVIPSICSASGTTIRGMEALEENGFANALYKAVKASAERSDELEIDSKERLA